MDWIKLEPWIPGKRNQIDTWPEEGIEVLVTDGTHYDVAWYLYSQSYMWMKTSVKQDDCVEFVNFVPTHWASISKVD